MSPPSADARLRYLDKISQALLVSSPAVAAHLQTARYAFSQLTEHPLDDSGLICRACGNRLISSWSCKRLCRKSGKETERSERVKCERCDRVTERPTVNSASIPEKRMIAAKRNVPPRTVHRRAVVEDNAISGPVPAESAKAAPRKRPRNKNATLQSMLKASQQAQVTTRSEGYGLNFQDLMKP